MKKIFIIAFFVISTSLMMAQDSKMTKSVIGGGGMMNSLKDGKTMSATVGQMALAKQNEFLYGFWGQDTLGASGIEELFTAESKINNYPNPFRNKTKIAFELDFASEVSLRIYDVNGKLIRTLLSSSLMSEGLNEIEWNIKSDFGQVSGSGSYLYELNVRPLGGSSTKEYSLRNVMVLSK